MHYKLINKENATNLQGGNKNEQFMNIKSNC